MASPLIYTALIGVQRKILFTFERAGQRSAGEETMPASAYCVNVFFTGYSVFFTVDDIGKMGHIPADNKHEVMMIGEMSDKKLVRAIRDHMSREGLNNIQLAAQAGLDKSTLNGFRTKPSWRPKSESTRLALEAWLKKMGKKS